MVQPGLEKPCLLAVTPTGTWPNPCCSKWGPRSPSDAKIYAALARSRTVFYTPTVSGPLSEFRKEVKLLTSRVSGCMDQDTPSEEVTRAGRDAAGIELLVIDESERLSSQPPR
jgi:hypothetical protein